MVIDTETSASIPVAWLVHKYNKAEILKHWLNNLGFAITDSPRHSAWPGPMPAGETFAATPFPGVTPFCPSHIIIDVSRVETNAILESLWGAGWSGVGQRRSKPVKIGYCLWHLTMAWSRNIATHVKKGTHAQEIKAALAVLCATPVRAFTVLQVLTLRFGVCSVSPRAVV